MFNFSPSKVIEVPKETPVVYNHGFTSEEVRKLEVTFKELERQSKTNKELTIADQIVIIKWNRIRRTEAFNLNPPKAAKTPRVSKEKKVREVKLKKLSKKDKEQMDNLKLLLEEGIITIESMPAKNREFYELNLPRMEIA